MATAVLPATPLPFPAKSVRFAAEADDCSQGELLEITVLSICGEKMAVVHASQDCSVARLKSAIAAQSSVPTAGQTLILGSCILEYDSESMSEVLDVCGFSGHSVIAMTLVIIPVDPFPKLYVDSCGTQLTAQRAEQTPKALDLNEDFLTLAGIEFPWALQCKECDGSLHEKTRDYDFATPNKKGNHLKVSASMWCPACRLVFKGLHRVVI